MYETIDPKDTKDNSHIDKFFLHNVGKTPSGIPKILYVKAFFPFLSASMLLHWTSRASGKRPRIVE